ncbi:Arc family DNA-binding protein [Ensifer sp. LC163]|uniref:Arc family DNA-binding protein n=1 Tax=Ensifer sp. LC163 TaxID=1120652 RepID=UPI001FCDDED2|nr:Arc family DNA-binding protein [Ensifer sp. LC163]
MKQKKPPFGLRMPDDVKDWVERQAKANMRSQNSEIVVALKEKMERLADKTISEKGPAKRA